MIPPEGLKITVEIVDIRGDKVRMGFEAPREVSVNREEVQRSIDSHGSRRDGQPR